MEDAHQPAYMLDAVLAKLIAQSTELAARLEYVNQPS